MQQGTVCSFSNDNSGLIFINASNPSEAQVFSNHQGHLSTASTSTPQPSPAVSPQNTTGSTPVPLSPSSNALEHVLGSQTFTALELDNLHLMIHYLTHAWRSIASDSNEEVDESDYELWHDIVPSLASKYPFMMHSLLAVSAVHFAQTSNSMSTPALVAMANLAQHHHTLSLPLMREALSNSIDSAAIQPLFLCALLIAVYAFARPLIPGICTAVDPLEEFAQALGMLRGTVAIVRSGPGLLDGTPLKVMLLLSPSNPEAPLDAGTEGYIVALKAAHARMTWLGGDEEAEAYNFVIGLLRNSFLLYNEAPSKQIAAVPFAVFLPEPVLSGIHEEKPLALCLIAGYSVVLHRLKEHHMVRGWGRRVMDGVQRKLAGSEWEGVIAWPLDVVLHGPSE